MASAIQKRKVNRGKNTHTDPLCWQHFISCWMKTRIQLSSGVRKIKVSNESACNLICEMPMKKTDAATVSGKRHAPTRLCSQEGRNSGVKGKASEKPDFIIQSLWHLAESKESEYFDYRVRLLYPDA